jgi:hypothetical protein
VTPLLALLPPLIEWAVRGLAGVFKKMSENHSVSVSNRAVGSLFAYSASDLIVNPSVQYIIAVFGDFAVTAGREPSRDRIDVDGRLRASHLLTGTCHVMSVIAFEGHLEPTTDLTGATLQTLAFQIDGNLDDKHHDKALETIITLAISAPNATIAGEAIAIASINVGKVAPGKKVAIDACDPRRFGSNLMPLGLTKRVAAVYEADVKRNRPRAEYMPVSFVVALSQTHDGDKFLASLGALLDALASPIGSIAK